MKYNTLHNKEKVQEWDDLLVVTVTERPELVSTFTPSKQSLSWKRKHNIFKKTNDLSTM